jgi:hypothetical protein
VSTVTARAIAATRGRAMLQIHPGENGHEDMQELIAIAVGIISALLTGQALAQPVQAARPAQARNVVPVHGACADGSS